MRAEPSAGLDAGSSWGIQNSPRGYGGNQRGAKIYWLVWHCLFVFPFLMRFCFVGIVLPEGKREACRTCRRAEAAVRETGGASGSDAGGEHVFRTGDHGVHEFAARIDGESGMDSFVSGQCQSTVFGGCYTLRHGGATPLSRGRSRGSAILWNDGSGANGVT